MPKHTTRPSSEVKIEPGYCQCGCGQKTEISKVNRTERGWIKGQPLRFVRGHNSLRDSGITSWVAIYGLSAPYGYCACGCGAKTTIAKETDSRQNKIKGEPARFIKGHYNAKPIVTFDVPTLPAGTRIIPLTQGKVTVVDEADYEELSRHEWHVIKSGQTWYAQRAEHFPDGTKRSVIMHRAIMDAPDNVLVDHKNGDGLLNTRDNLRLATRSQNNSNAAPRAVNTSGYKGVSWYKRDKNWKAQIGANGKMHHLGYFATAEAAARVYDEAARHYFGEFAWLNFKD